MQNLWALPAAGASGLLVKDSPATSRSRLLCAVAVFVAAMHADAITIDQVTHFQLATFRYMIGCTNSRTPEVKGPLGSINNDAATGEYFFPTLKTFTGSTFLRKADTGDLLGCRPGDWAAR